MKKTIRLGTRESQLALAQTKLAAQALKEAFPEIETEICGRRTLGDRILDRPLLSFGGKGVFVTEFEEALKEDKIDFAVHSAKDLPARLAEGMEIVAVLPAEDPRDVLVTRKEEEGAAGPEAKDSTESGKKYETRGIRIGTSSLRRSLQMERLGERLWPGRSVVCENLRGNVLTRLDRLENGDFDGIILAAAGLKRLDIEKIRPDRYSFHYFSEEEMIPAGGQGILAIEGRIGNPVNELAQAVCHKETWIRFLAERRVLEALEAGCHEPVGVHCRLELEDENREERGTEGWGDADCFCGRLILEGMVKRDGIERRERTQAAFKTWKEAEEMAVKAADRLAGILSGKGFVWLVGAGPGDPGLITVKGAELLRNCDCIVYDHLVETSLLHYRKEGCELLFVGKEKGRHSMVQEQINELLIRKAQEGKQIVRLKGGDPFVFGRGGEEAAALNRAGIPWQVVPGVTSATAALASAGIPITHRAVSRSFHVITGHTRQDGGLPEDFYHLGQCGGSLVFLMGLSHLEEIARGLLKQGMSPDMPAAVIERGTLPGQRMVRASLGTIAEETRKAGLKPPAVILVGETAGIDLGAGNRGPLEGTRVGIVGTEHLVNRLRPVLEELGAGTSVLCSMEVVPINSREREESCRHLQEYSWLVFTSANGVRLYLDGLLGLSDGEKMLDLRSLAHMKIAAVGEGTAKELKRYGLYCDYIPKRFYTRDLAQGLAGILKPEDRVLIPRAIKGSQELGEIFAKAGVSFRDLPIYDVRGHFNPDIQDRPDVAVFASASGVHAFMEGGGKEILADVPAVCIGEVCGAALKAHGIQAAEVAGEASAEGLAEAVVRWKTGKSR